MSLLESVTRPLSSGLKRTAVALASKRNAPLSAVFCLGVVLAGIGDLLDIPVGLGDLCRALGGSMVAGVVVAAFVTRHDVRLDRIDQEQRDKNNAIATFPDSSIPTVAYRDAFVQQIGRSSRYEYIGGTGLFTAFRLTQHHDHPEIQNLEEIRLYLHDPSEERYLEVLAHRRKQDMKSIRLEIFIALYSLFSVRSSITSTIHLTNHDHAHERYEIFDEGVFQTPYGSFAAYPSTNLYSHESEVYAQSNNTLKEARKLSTRLLFGFSERSKDRIDSDEDFAKKLDELGCELNFAELDAEQRRLFGQFRQDSTAGGLEIGELF